jgi:DNA-binding GntR family transcriptional regulator
MTSRYWRPGLPVREKCRRSAIALPEFPTIIIDIDFGRYGNPMSTRLKLATAGPRPGLVPLLNMKKGEAAYHAVRRSILLGHIRPGDMLLEQGIAEQLNCSQGTVREVLLRLEQDGLVSRRGYRGTVVSTTSVQEAAQMVEFRMQIECTGIRRSVRSLRSEAMTELVAITQEMDAAVQALDLYRCSEIDRHFHMLLFRQSGLPALEPILNRCALHLHRFTYWNADSVSPEMSIGDTHRALLRTFQARDPETAAAAIRIHIGEVVDRWAPPLGQELRRMHDRSN